MIKFLDKFLPSTCVVLATFFMGTALYLHADTTLENTNTNPTSEETLNKETQEKTKILLVPGHDYEYSGATFKNIKESDLTVKTATFLKDFLEKDSSVEVYITREDLQEDICLLKNKNDYIEIFQKYFKENKENVLAYRDFHRNETEKFDKQNNIEPINNIEHNIAPEEVIYRLYAINKWVEENKIDLVIHLHFNDYPQRPVEGGKFQGFSIFMPDNILKNSKNSQVLAEEIGQSLNKFLTYSNNPPEKLGIVPSNELIAVGANNTISAASVLIEYGYIYEEKFQDDNVLKKVAEQTYLGIKNYLTKN
jgi:N-acetylmuramoyl-L-alanine amidase